MSQTCSNGTGSRHFQIRFQYILARRANLGPNLASLPGPIVYVCQRGTVFFLSCSSVVGVYGRASRGCRIFHPNETNLGLFKINFSTFWLGECTKVLVCPVNTTQTDWLGIYSNCHQMGHRWDFLISDHLTTYNPKSTEKFIFQTLTNLQIMCVNLAIFVTAPDIPVQPCPLL